MPQNNTESAHDVVAWSIVNLNVSVPLDYFINLSPASPLFNSLVKHWKIKQDAETEKFAMIACTIANVMGNNKMKPKDFYVPMSGEIRDAEQKQKEAGLKNYLMRYNLSKRQK